MRCRWAATGDERLKQGRNTSKVQVEKHYTSMAEDGNQFGTRKEIRYLKIFFISASWRNCVTSLSNCRLWRLWKLYYLKYEYPILKKLQSDPSRPVVSFCHLQILTRPTPLQCSFALSIWTFSMKRTSKMEWSSVVINVTTYCTQFFCWSIPKAWKLPSSIIRKELDQASFQTSIRNCRRSFRSRNQIVGFGNTFQSVWCWTAWG